jgi:hypothetical protein
MWEAIPPQRLKDRPWSMPDKGLHPEEKIFASNTTGHVKAQHIPKRETDVR